MRLPQGVCNQLAYYSYDKTSDRVQDRCSAHVQSFPTLHNGLEVLRLRAAIDLEDKTNLEPQDPVLHLSQCNL